MLLSPLVVMTFTFSVGGVWACLCASSALGLWVGMELNMLSFISFVQVSGDSKHSAMPQYFVSQSLGSLLFLFSILSENYLAASSSLLILISMGLKAGVAPLHFWFILVMTKLKWESLFFLSTLQKMIPLSILMSLNPEYLTGLIVGSGLVAVMGIFSQKYIKKIMAYSSVFSAAWVLAASPNWNSGLIYLLVYAWGVWVLGVALSRLSVETLGLKTSVLVKQGNQKALVISLFSLGGLPPFLGFFVKLLIINQLLVGLKMVELIFLVIFGGLILLGYTRVMVNSLKLMSSVSALSWRKSFEGFSMFFYSVSLVLPGILMFLSLS